MRAAILALLGLTAAAQVPGPKDKCPVCGMFVAKFPTWVTVLRTKEGAVRFADGPKDALKVLLDPGRLGARPGELSVQLKDYYGLKPLEAREAWYEVDSDVRGPMGRELVPFRTEAEAQAFRKEHHGRLVLRLADITPAVLKALE